MIIKIVEGAPNYFSIMRKSSKMFASITIAGKGSDALKREEMALKLKSN